MNFILGILICLHSVYGVGMLIPPVSVGHTHEQSSLDYLYNCISYSTVKDDMVVVHIDAGDPLPSQLLHLKVFDNENNHIRVKHNLAHSVDLIFTNLNNPQQFDDQNDLIRRSHFLDKLVRRVSPIDELVGTSGKSLIHICFDNVYSDRLWSFTPESHYVDLSVEIKDFNTIKKTNYNNFAKYFQHKQAQQDRVFDEQDFEERIKFIETELNVATENVHNSELILKTLMDAEFELRDVNESIYDRYTKATIALITCICVFGLGQIIYFKCLLRRTKVL